MIYAADGWIDSAKVVEFQSHKTVQSNDKRLVNKF